jgi:hypothetical protein
LVPLQFLYHYTNREDFNKILQEQIVRKSPSGPSGRYGAGVYLTSLTPDKGRNKIKKNNLDGLYNMPQYDNKTEECYLKFKKEDLDAVRFIPTNGGRDVWLNSNDINLRVISYYSGYTDYSDEEEYHPCVAFAGQQQTEEIGLGGIVAGTAAVVAVGAAAFGLFAASRQSRQQNNQQ